MSQFYKYRALQDAINRALEDACKDAGTDNPVNILFAVSPDLSEAVCSLSGSIDAPAGWYVEEAENEAEALEVADRFFDLRRL